MAKLIVLPLLLAALAGCRTMTPPGSNSEALLTTAPAESQVIARDVVKKLVTLYPPAKTRFDLQQTAADSFGLALVEQMRSKGYALAEYRPASMAKSPQAAVAVGAVAASPATRLSYFIDQPGDIGLYRVTLTINRQSLTRAYQAGAGKVSPASYWVRKE